MLLTLGHETTANTLALCLYNLAKYKVRCINNNMAAYLIT